MTPHLSSYKIEQISCSAFIITFKIKKTSGKNVKDLRENSEWWIVDGEWWMVDRKDSSMFKVQSSRLKD